MLSYVISLRIAWVLLIQELRPDLIAPPKSAVLLQPLVSEDATGRKRLVRVIMPVWDIPRVFDLEGPVYLYHPVTNMGRWTPTGDTWYQPWQSQQVSAPLKLFSVGGLPDCALEAAAEQGIHLPYWRDSLRKMEGWVIAGAHLVQTNPGCWQVTESSVRYTGDPASSDLLGRIVSTETGK